LALGGAVLVLGEPLCAQFAMPDPKQMSGIPRPVTDLPERTISVRVIRGDLSKNIPNQSVDLLVDGKAQTVKTDANGRAEFGPLTPGATVKAVAVVDGERLESQEFPSPPQGGVRLLLVATDKEKEARAAEEAKAPAVTGTVVLAGETRLVIEPDEESARVYYLLDITNTARAPVNPPANFEFEAPSGAVSVSVMEGSSPQARVTGRRVQVGGPFPPGNTFVQIGYVMPLSDGTVDIAQAFPATIEHLGVIVKKVGDARLSSPQIERQQEMPASNQMYIAAAGGTVQAGRPVQLTLSGLPHHSATPRWVALGLASTMLILGVWFSTRAVPDPAGTERKHLIARREKLFQDLLRLEADHRRGKGDQSRYLTRREDLLAALEHIYGALDTEETNPDPAGRAGMAA
jgi:hypothetical protein